ncbi:Cysteine protease atg4 [Ceratobasidium sp. UAMH 11750]|nr:Cysteine protease atg4 [Ceratobasidium sp. UAMH 11750]
MPSSSTSPTSAPTSQKLSKLLRKHDPPPQARAPTAQSSSQAPEPTRSRRIARKPSRTLPNDPSTPTLSVDAAATPDAEISRAPSTASQAVARAQTRGNPAPELTVIAPSPSVRLGDLPARLSGWFSHLTGSNTDLGLATNLSSAAHMVPAASPKRVPSISRGSPSDGGPLSTAARHGKGHFDKIMRYITDSDATPDHCTDPIWLLGVQHPGYEPPDPSQSPPPPQSPTMPAHRRDSTESSLHTQLHRKNRAPPGAFTLHPNPSLTSISSFTIESGGPSKYAGSWPPAFYEDFTSLLWLTYRSHYTPIRDTSLEALAPLSPCDQDMLPRESLPASPRRWNWPGQAEKIWTSDTGWGCMLRTGQSLLANALIHLHLGRNWRRPHYPMFAEEHAIYVKILTWFFDTPSPLAPFGVHRMALAGKALGKDVGTWFGPSTAAGSIKTLVHAFPEAQLSVSLAVDGTVFASDVYAASHLGMVASGGRSISSRKSAARWGGRAVLILVNIRLGIDNVNPIYYEALKSLFQFPQSVGISGGRPSSSYYFVGTQADSLFYLDPHHTRPVIPLRPPPSVAPDPPEDADENDEPTSANVPATPNAKQRRPSTPEPHPTPRPRISSPASPASSSYTESNLSHHYTRGRSSLSPPSYHPPLPPTILPSSLPTSKLQPLIPGGIDSPDGIHYCAAYSAAELRTFHCDRVRKMPLSALDPSMLLGFLCRDDAEWKDFRARVADMSKTTRTLFSIADERPAWSDIDSDDMGLESVSEPDMESVADDPDDFFDTQTGESRSVHSSAAGSQYARVASKHSETASQPRRGESELSTTDESMEVVTPGPRHSAKFDMSNAPVAKDATVDDEDEDDDDWVDPTPPPADVRQLPRAENGAPISVSISATPSPDLLPVPTSAMRASDSPSSCEGLYAQDSPTGTGRFNRSHDGQDRYPFPAGDAEEEPLRYPKSSGKPPQLRNVRARDGGRTKRGGVRGLVGVEGTGDDF